MSDFFMIENNDYWNKKVDETKKEQNKQANQNTGVFNQRIEEYKKLQQERYENIDRYGVEIPDEYYEIFNQIIGKAESPEVAQEEAYRLGSAIKYSQLMNEPFLDVYKNVDAYNEANFPDLTDQKTRFEAISDMFSMGINNVQLGKLGQKLMKAIRENDTELTNALMAEIDAINQNNVLLQDNTPRRWIMQALEAGAQSLPFTGYVAGAGTIGNFIHPAVGTGAAFVASSYLSAGQEYLDLLANGADPQTAEIVATVSGGIQGIIEANLGITNGIVKGTAKTLGKDVARNAAEKSLEEIGRKVFKRFHFGAGKKLLLNYLKQYGKNILGEGAEEFLQEITSIAGQEIAASLDGYDIPDDNFKSIVKQTTEAFRGGVLGALSMGFIPAGINGAADIKSFKNVKEIAETYESGEMFKEAVKDNPVFEGMKDDQKNKVIQEVWERAQQRKEEETRAEAQNYAETLDAGEGAEQKTKTVVNENGEEEEIEAEPEPIHRENGKLDIQDDEHVNDDGTTTGTYVVGDSTKEGNNRYGYITYTADEDNKTVTIDTFKMTEGREGLRGEFYDEFAQKYAGYDIKWNPIQNESQRIKEALIADNPSGKKAGLNYYSENDIVDFGSRKEAAKIIGETFHNIEERNGALIQTPLSKEQIATGVAFLELGAKLSEETLNDFMNKNFNNRQFIGPRSELIESAIKNNISPEKVYGGFEWKNFGKDLKAVIYAGQNADFDTFIHECTHMFQSLLTGDLKKEAERLFNVQEGDWRNSTYVLPDGRKMSSAEAFVEMYQDWVIRKKAPSQEHENIFKKLAQFIVDAYTRMKEHFTLTPEIENLFDKLLAEDDGAYAKALKAVEENDREYKATLKRKAEEETNARKAKAEEEKKTQEAEREAKSETTDFTEEEKKLTPEEAEKQLDEVTNENTEKENNAIDDALENTNLTDEQKKEVADVLTNEASTEIDKAEATTEAASSAYIPDDLIFQTSKIIPVGTGDFGEIYDCFKGQPNQAIAFLISKQSGEAVGALHHKDIGDIDLVWGKEGTGDSDGYGLSKLIKFHPEVLANLQEILDSMEVVQRSANRIQLENDTHKASIRLTWNGKNKKWLLTAYEKESSVSDSRTDIAGTDNSSKNDTPTLANTADNDNNTTNENVNDLLFQIAGEIGAQNLDNAEVQEGVSRMQNLAIAKQMEAENKDAKTIRLATGWEKGGDGFWKYELDDNKIRLYDEQFFPKRHLSNDAEYNRIDQAIKDADYNLEAIPIHDRQYWEAYNDAESEYVRQFIDFDNGKAKWKQTVNLERILNAPELFTAYPQLKKVQFVMQDLPDGVMARWENNKNRITVSPWARRNHLLHEIQHVIQDIEGFAKGGNESQFKTKDYSKERIESLTQQAHELFNKQDENWKKLVRKYNEASINKDYETTSQISDELENDAVFNEYVDLISKATSIKEGTTSINYVKTPQEQYKNLYGEVEARNVQKRINFTPEQRTNTLLSATEDVAPEDRIILFQTVYHGSPYNFENFSTENIGTGEGAQAFGWGLYFTNQEGIARFYADKLANEPKRISLIAKNEYLKSRKKALKNVENKEKYEAKIYKNIKEFTKELKQAQKAGDEKDIKFYEGLIDDSMKQLDENERLSLIESFKKDIANAEQEIAELKASMKNDRNLYTVDIPDEGYVVWDKPLTSELINKVNEGLKKLEAEKKFYSDMEMSAGYNPWNIQYEEYMKAPENYKGEDLYGYLEKVLHSDKAASLFLKDLGYIGIDYPAHSLSGYTSQDERNYVIFDEANANIQNHLLYQKAYHGSGADFDKFDTENFGLSGEGSMSFGYGTYLTDNEDIARDYAERQKEKILDMRWYPMNHIKKYMNSGLSFEDAKQKEIEDIKRWQADAWDRLKKEQYEYQLQMLENITQEELFSDKARHLYTVEIPDNGYIQWDKTTPKNIRKHIADGLYNKLIQEDYKGAEKELSQELTPIIETPLSGKEIYDNIWTYLGSDKEASQFLKSIGFNGIKYPAGTIHGNGNGAYNYVIFNDDDAKIVGHLFFQTQSELLDDALSFDNWQDFMDFYETKGKPEVTPIPYDADAQWYQSFWEMAHGMQTEQEKNENAMYDKAERDGSVPMALDALFETSIKSNPEILDNFLKAAAYIDGIDLETEWSQVEDAESAKERERIEQLKDAINITLSDRNWHSAIARIQGGNEITEGQRKRLMGEITDSFKLRDFRALYSEIMDDEQFAVDEEDTVAAQLSKKLSKYNKKYDILKPNEDIARMSPEKHKRIAEELQNREIANKIANGSLKLDDELDAYYKSLNKQVKEKQKQFDELEAMQKSDYQRIADWETRQLLKLHDELILARGRMTRRSAETDRMIKKGLKITEKYRLESQNLNANYDEIFRKFSDLKNSIQITAEVQAMLDRQEQVANAKEDLNAKNKEKNLIAEVKKMRIQLVKRTMRRVPFNRIDYENAKTIIAVQRMLEPNLLGGVNRFIGIDSPFLRGVISGILTDSEYKEKLLRYLEKTSKASEAYVNFKKKLMDLKSMKDFDSWTAKERKYAIKHLPKENWVHELNLNQLAKEREESIDLDIGMKEIQEPVYDESTGERKTYKDADGNEHFATRTGFRLEYDKEIGKLVQDAVGADMFDRIINKPFSEWTTEELEQLAQRIDELYTEGRDLHAAKNKARKQEAERIRTKIEDAILETGITINDDDTEEERERKQQQIIKILGLNDNSLKGTEGEKSRGIKAKLDRLIHSYNDLNVLRFARIMDGQSEGENVRMLYRREDDCFNVKQRSIYSRTSTVNKIMKDNNITEGDLAKSIKVPALKTEFTVDELLYFLAADKDYAEDERKLAAGFNGLDANDDLAPTSRNAVMFGNMLSDTASQQEKEMYNRLDKEIADAIENDTLTPEQKEALAIGQLDKHPGTTKYIASCHAKWQVCIATAKRFLESHPEYNALMEAIEADYAAQYERMNEVSINEFNTPVHRVKAYVPLVRRESNGDPNVNQVKEDLLGAYGSESGKQWVNRGMTQRRQTISPLHQRPVQTGLFRTWADSIERTEHFIAYSPYVRQLNAVYKSRDAAYTRRFIEARYGKAAVEYIDNYINEVANPNANKIREKGAELLHTLRGKTAPAYLGWKFSAIVKQGLTSPWPYMQFVNPAEYLAACFKCINGGYDAIKEKSVFMKSRVMDPVNELVDEMADQAKNKFDKAWSKFAKTGMAGLEWIDWACVAPGWLACYEKEYNRLQKISEAKYEAKIEELKTANMYADISTREYLTPEQIEAKAREELLQDIEIAAVQYADDCTRQCQPSSRMTDLAPRFKNSSEAMKAFLQFQTSLNVIWQNIRYDLPYAIKNKQFNRIAGTICGYVFAGIFMNSVMDGVSGDDDDDKEMQALRNLIYYSTTQFTDAIPIMGSEITNTMDQLITGKRGFYGSGTDMTPSATKLLSALQKAQSGNWEKAAALTAEGIGIFMGAPVSGIKEINKLLGKPLDEGDVNLLRGISDVYGLAGDIIGE